MKGLDTLHFRLVFIGFSGYWIIPTVSEPHVIRATYEAFSCASRTKVTFLHMQVYLEHFSTLKNVNTASEGAVAVGFKGMISPHKLRGPWTSSLQSWRNLAAVTCHIS